MQSGLEVSGVRQSPPRAGPRAPGSLSFIARRWKHWSTSKSGTREIFQSESSNAACRAAYYQIGGTPAPGERRLPALLSTDELCTARRPQSGAQRPKDPIAGRPGLHPENTGNSPRGGAVCGRRRAFIPTPPPARPVKAKRFHRDRPAKTWVCPGLSPFPRTAPLGCRRGFPDFNLHAGSRHCRLHRATSRRQSQNPPRRRRRDSLQCGNSSGS
jgi:hypothetical protein